MRSIRGRDDIPIDSDNVISAGKWYHVVGVLKPNYDMELYVNGVLQAYTKNAGSINPLDGTPMWIGKENFYLDGVVDDVRIYNRALSATEIQNLYNASSLQCRAGRVLEAG